MYPYKSLIRIGDNIFILRASYRLESLTVTEENLELLKKWTNTSHYFLNQVQAIFCEEIDTLPILEEIITCEPRPQITEFNITVLESNLCDDNITE